jgi:HAE1 family hydrophobic/amphiphilic exporter-1
MSANVPTAARAREGAWSMLADRPVAVLMLMVAFAVFGGVSLGKLPVDLLPEISYPTLTVRTTYRGAAPEDIEDRVSVRLAEALSTLPGLVRSTSISRAETSDLVLEFDWGTPMTFAVQDVRDKLDGVRLPDGAERPLILRYDPNLDPILRIGLTSSDKRAGEDRIERLIQLRWLAEKRIKRELEAIPGVAAVQVRGGLQEEIRVRVDPFKMAAQSLDPALLAQRLAAENINASGGLIREGSTEYLVRTLNEFATLQEIENLALVRRGDAVIRVRDVATVERTFAEREVTSRIAGAESVEIAVYREAGANIVALAEDVKKRVLGDETQRKAAEEIQKRGEGSGASWGERERVDYLAWRYRDEVRFELLSDQSTFIRDAVNDVKDSAIVGSILTVLVILAFLRQIASTLIIAVTIPASVIVTFAPMYLFDVSMNIMSLGGLALGVGMLLDNSIVVLESIARLREDGLSLRDATIRGTREVASAMAASTMTSISVFAPIVFVHGIAGQIFGDQALTVVASQIISLGVGIVFIPMLVARPWISEPFSSLERGPDDVLSTLHGLSSGTEGASARAWALLRRALTWPFEDWSWRPARIVGGLARALGRGALAAFGLLAALTAALVFGLVRVLGIVFAPLRILFDVTWRVVERGYVRLLAGSLAAPLLTLLLTGGLFYLSVRRVDELGVELLPEIHQGEFTLHVATGVGNPLEATDEVLRELDERIRAIDGVAMTALTVGVEKDTLTREIEGKHTARLTVRLKPSALPREEEFVAQIRELFASHPSVRSVDISRPTPFAIEAPISVEVLGHDLERLSSVGREVHARMSAMKELTDVRSSVRSGYPELRVSFDRDKTLEYGLDLTAVTNLVRDQVLGAVSTRFTDGEEKIDVRVRGDEILLDDVERVMRLVVNPSSPTPVELRSVAEITPVQGPAEIRRIGNTRAVVITATGVGVDLGGLSTRIEEELADLELPDDITVELGGQKREMDKARTSMAGALALALFLVYVVMACQFESLLQPLVILLTVPLALVGVVWVLLGLAIPVSVVVFIGLILLAGIVVNNAIVLLDRINQNREGGMELHAAITEAGNTRLRPILMTATASVMGLLPMTGWLAPLPWIGQFGAGEGAEIRAPMAITVVAGLAASTLLTLVVIPVVYWLTERALERRAS